MKNPWEEIRLSDYERHMSLSSVQQLQQLDALMGEQLADYSVTTVCILGVAGGNGLRHVDPAKIRRIYGVDINRDYLDACLERYPSLKGCFEPICADLTRPDVVLPAVELLIADLFIEYVGCACFARTVGIVRPQTVSCVIQVDPQTDAGFVSDSPYREKLDALSAVHHTICADELTREMERIGYFLQKTACWALPNAKQLRRIDYRSVHSDNFMTV